jgi:hypothetical protein
MKGINLAVYSNPKYRGCAVGGISEKFDELLIVCDRGFIEINGDEENLVQLVHRVIGGKDVYHLAPIDNKGQYSFGGSYASSCDNRFCEMHGIYGALAIHDRKEW